MRAALTILLVLAAVVVAEAQIKAVQFVVIVPDSPADQPIRIFVCSSADDWREQGRPLPRVAPGVYAGVAEYPTGGELQYKFTREQSWATVEKGAAGDELANHVLKLDPSLSEQVVIHVVARWADRPPAEKRRVEWSKASDNPTSAPTSGPAGTLTGTIRFHYSVRSPQLDNERTVAVYLPPGYDEHPDQRYPVLYMQDGNNLFDARTSFAGEWHADETAERLIEAGEIEPLIIVGIYNTPGRLDEYTPMPDRQRGGGKGDAYLAFVVEKIKPRVDQTYRTRPDRDSTAIGGSSLGGLISLYALHKHPQVFGKAMVVSPTLTWADRGVLGYVREHPASEPRRLWLDIGTEEWRQPGQEGDTDYVLACRELVRMLESQGWQPGRDFRYLEVAGGRHHESAWSARFDQMLIFLFGKAK